MFYMYIRLFLAHGHTTVFVGAVDPSHTHHWQWASSQHGIPLSMFAAGSGTHGHYCAATNEDVHALVAVDCTSRYQPLCQAEHKWCHSLTSAAKRTCYISVWLRVLKNKNKLCVFLNFLMFIYHIIQLHFHNKKLEAQGPCTGHRSIIAILYCFSFKYMKSEKGKDLTDYTNLCGLNTLPHYKM